MHKLAIIALAAAMGLAWSTMPAVAADSDKTVKDKAVDAKDTVKEKTSEAWDKTKAKTSEAWDKTKAKTSEAWDKTKEKSTEAKDKVKDTARDTKDKLAGKMESSSDIRQAQTALKEKGHDPGPIDGIHGRRTSAALRSYQKAENIKVTGRLDGETRTHLMGQASATPSTATPAASPSTVNQPVPPPASVGSPSNPPMPAEKAQTK
jgi:peptidoglycan hydrolase-like protein with peptidoglycan-binding domain